METTLLDSAEAAPARRRRKLVRRLVQVTIAVLGVALAWRMVQALSWDDLSLRIREARPVLLVTATLLLAARWYFWQARWALSISRAGQRSTFLRRATALMASVFVNHVALRFFGGVLRGRYMAAGRAKDFALQYGIVLFDQLMHQAATTVYTWLAVAYVFFLLGWKGLGVTAMITLILLLAAIPFIVGREGWLRKVAARIGEKASGSERLDGLVQQGSAIPRVMAKLLASIPHVTHTAILTWVYIGANVLAQWLLFRAIGADVPLLVVGAVLGIGSVIGTLTGLPGGLGPMEAALLGGYDLLGIGRLEAVAGTLLYRGLHYILVLAFGLPSLITVELGLERAREGQRSEEPESRT
ncbi:MAG: flippase-like domain-containing protein [bacterium]|nr:flippase-like domain-containing protein [bacterium]